MKNIIAQLGSETFMRIKVGVGGKPEGYDLVDYVLGHFSKEERERMAQAQQDACSAVEAILTDGADEAMNRFNRKGKKAEPKQGAAQDAACGMEEK